MGAELATQFRFMDLQDLNTPVASYEQTKQQSFVAHLGSLERDLSEKLKWFMAADLGTSEIAIAILCNFKKCALLAADIYACALGLDPQGSVPENASEVMSRHIQNSGILMAKSFQASTCDKLFSPFELLARSLNRHLENP